jgi:hypothetical protein
MTTMRRKDKEIAAEEAIRLLTECEYGVLSTVDADGQPYGIPLNYVYTDHQLYFHCALGGHKLDNIQSNPKVSFCVVGHCTVLPSRFGTEYESAVAFGVASEVHGPERHAALLALLSKYSADYMEAGKAYIQKHDAATRVIKISITRISGKNSPAKPKP